MKKLILSLLAISTFFSVQADEGMWIPMLIGKNYEEMKKMGLKLSAEDLYHTNNASLKDAIVHFGGGCTGEIISPNGLLITNHHCGYGQIADLSTVEQNYLEDGFWAKNHEQELPAKGLSVKFLVRMEDVTEEVMKALDRGNEKKQAKLFSKTIESLEKKATENGRYSAQVSSYFNGNQYILLVYETFTDVRLVATPPKSLGKYGGDTDNWIWPRHTADFSVFRVYAGKDNKPAAYSKANVPYQPKHFLPVSIKGVNEGDYAMIMGYPGRTNRYETSYGVDLAITETNPSVVKIRDMRLSIMRKYMRENKAVNLKLATKYASVANYWKYFIGQTEQLKRLNVIADKQQQEKDFIAWSKTNNKTYANLMTDFSKLYTSYRPYAKHNVYYGECFRGSALAALASRVADIKEVLEDKKAKPAELQAAVGNLRKARTAMMKEFEPAVEQEMLAATAGLFYKDIPSSQHPAVYQNFIFKQFGNEDWSKTFDDFAAYTFAHTLLLDNVKFEQFCNKPTIAAMEADPAIKYALSFVDNYEKNFNEKQAEFAANRNKLAKDYIKGLMEKNKDKMFYPDANSTMRLTYGTVGGYSPKDAVQYSYYTTLDGMLAKYKPGDYEFDLQQDFRDLAATKDFGRYANEDGELVTCFITNNDITGGNSGSPMINANGELTGLAFDGNWEAMSGDIAFDKQYKKTIAVDIRFVLWLIDKYGKAPNLIEEMTVVE